VAVPPGHPFHGKGWKEVEDHLEIHGGITYAEACAGHICHVPEPGEPDNVWWLGFDCAHAFDRRPASIIAERTYPPELQAMTHSLRQQERYWTMADAMAETERLADQLAALGAKA